MAGLRIHDGARQELRRHHLFLYRIIIETSSTNHGLLERHQYQHQGSISNLLHGPAQFGYIPRPVIRLDLLKRRRDSIELGPTFPHVNSNLTSLHSPFTCLRRTHSPAGLRQTITKLRIQNSKSPPRRSTTNQQSTNPNRPVALVRIYDTVSINSIEQHPPFNQFESDILLTGPAREAENE